MHDQSVDALGKNRESSRKATLVFTFVLLCLQSQQAHNECVWGLHLDPLQSNDTSEMMSENKRQRNAREQEPNLFSL